MVKRKRPTSSVRKPATKPRKRPVPTAKARKRPKPAAKARKGPEPPSNPASDVPRAHRRENEIAAWHEMPPGGQSTDAPIRRSALRLPTQRPINHGPRLPAKQ